MTTNRNCPGCSRDAIDALCDNWKVCAVARSVSAGKQGAVDLQSVLEHGRVVLPASCFEARSLCRLLAIEKAAELDTAKVARRRTRDEPQ